MRWIFRKTRRALITGGIGALIAYFFDPDRGRARRARTKDQVASKARRATRDAATKGRYVAGQVEGLAAEASGAGTPHPVDDTTVKQEIRAALERLPFPTSNVNITVVDGKAELRGEVQHPDEVERVEKTVSSVPGVRTVDAMLHLPDTPAPNKRQAREAS